MNYLYVFDLKPPGIHFLFAFAQMIAGDTMLSIRLFDIVWQSVTAFIILLITFRLTGNRLLSYIGSFLYLFLYYRQDYWHTLQADGMLNLPFALSVLLLISSYDRHSFLKITAAGILMAAALIFKYTIISFLPLLIICFLFSKKEQSSLKIKNIIYFFAGIIFTGTLVLLLYYFTGALGALADIQLVQTPLYTKIAYETETSGYITAQIIRLFTFSVYAPLILFSLASIVIVFIKKRADFTGLIVFSWLISSIFSLIIQWKFYHYHFLVILPSIIIGALYFVSIILKPGSEKFRKIAITGFALIFVGYLIFAFKPYISNYSTLYGFLSGKVSLKESYIKNGTTTDSVFMIEKTFKAIDYVNQNTEIDDKIYVWGFDPLIYYISGRECSSRFIYNFPLLWKSENSDFRHEFIRNIKEDSPKLILVAKNDPLYFISGYNEDSKQLLERFAEFRNIIKDKYEFRQELAEFDIYELKHW